MDKQNIGRLNQLFEKMVASAISSSEKNELDILYSRFIDEGRTVQISDAEVLDSISIIWRCSHIARNSSRCFL